MPTTIDQMVDLMVEDGQSEENILRAKEEKASQDKDPDIPGCMDPMAINYNPKATVDDGSCQFDNDEDTEIYEIEKTKSVTELGKIDPKTLVKKRPDKQLKVPVNYFGEDIVHKDGSVGTSVTDKSEEEIVIDLNKRLNGLGLDVKTALVGTEGFEITSLDGGDAEKVFEIGIWETLFPFPTMSSTGAEEKADKLNTFIIDMGRQLEGQDEFFDFDLYQNNFYTVNTSKYEKDDKQLNIDQLTFDQLEEHRNNLFMDLRNEFFKSEVGKTAVEDIGTELREKSNTFFIGLLEEASLKGLSAEDAAKRYMELMEQAQEDAWDNNVAVRTMMNTNAKVIGGVFDKRLIAVAATEEKENQFYPFVAKSKFLSGVARTALISIPMQAHNMQAMNKSERLEAAYRVLENMKNLEVADPDKPKFKFKDVIGTENKILFFDRTSEDAVNIKSKQSYNISELKPQILKIIEYNERKFFEHMMKSSEYQDVLNKMPSEQFLTEDGKLNINATNFQEILGDQFSQLLFAMFSGGFTTNMQEGGEAFHQIVQGKAIQRAGIDKWRSMNKEEQIKAMEYIVDSGAADIGTAKTVGALNMAYENISNLFFLSKMGKPAKEFLGSNLRTYFDLFTKGKWRVAMKNLAKNVNVTDITQVTFLESLTEAMQETTLQFGVNSSLGDRPWSWNPIFNSALTAFLTTPILGAGTKTVSTFSSEFGSQIALLNNSESILAKCRAQQKELTRSLTANEITEEKYYELMEPVVAAEKSLGQSIHKNVTHKESVETIFNAELKKIKVEKERKEKLKKKEQLKKDNPQVDEALIDKLNLEGELRELNKQLRDLNREQIKARKLDDYKNKSKEKQEEINGDIRYNQNWEALIFEETDQAINHLIELGIDPKTVNKQFQGFINGNNGFVLSREELQQLIPGYEGKGIALVSDENITNNINAGTWFAENALQHEFEHVKMYEKFKGPDGLLEMQFVMNEINNILEMGSLVSPQMEYVATYLNERLRDYKKKYKGKENKRPYIEEFFASLSDVTKGLSLESLTEEGSSTYIKIGEVFNTLLYGREAVVNDFDNVENIIGFTTHLDSGNEVTENVHLNEDGDVIHGVTVGPPLESIAGEPGGLPIIRATANTKYKQNRSNDAIAAENKRLGEEIKKAKNYVNKDNKVLQEKMRTQGTKDLRERLMYNNWGAFETLLGNYYKTDHPGHSQVKQDFFYAEALMHFLRATQTYDPEVNDAFGAYYFGSDPKYPISKITAKPMSTAEVRIAGIWEKMKKTYTEQAERGTGEEFEKYDQNNSLDIEDRTEDHVERSILRETMPGMDVNSEKYVSWINIVKEELPSLMENIYDEDAKSKVRERGRDAWKKFKALFDEKVYKDYLPTQEYIDWFTESAETIYNQIPQKVMNENYAEFTKLVIQRMSSELSRKQKDVKSDTAGNSKYVKLPFEEVKDAWIEKHLKTNQIAELQAQGLTNAEIHKIVRMDMTQEATFKHLSDILFKDAVMQVTTSPEFIKEHGIDESQIIQAGILLERGLDVKFSIRGDETGAGFYEGVIDGDTNHQFFLQETARLRRLVEDHEYDNEWEMVVSIIENDKKATQQIKDFVISLYDRGAVESAGESYFKGSVLTNENISEEAKESFKNSGPIRRLSEDSKRAMMDNAIVLAKIFGKEFMAVTGMEFLGLKSGNRYLDISGRKVNPEYRKGIDPIEDRYLKGVKGEYNEEYIELLESLESVELPTGLNISDAAIMNKDYGKVDTGIFKQLIKILKQDKLKKWKLNEIQRTGLADKIEAADKANKDMIVHIVTKISEQLVAGNLDEAGVLNMLQMQTNMVFGFRGLSGLSLFQVMDGAQNFEWKGEHLKSMSQLNSELADIMFRYKNNPKGVDLDTEIRAVLVDYNQAVGDTKLFDKLDIYGKTNISTTNRLAIFNQYELNSFTNVRGENVKDIQARILYERLTKQSVIKEKKKAAVVAKLLNPKTKTRGVSVFDFDKTVGISTNYVIATKEGETRRLNSSQWASNGLQLMNEGWEMDFTDFNVVTEGRPGPLMQKLKNQIAKYGVKNVHILTARHADSALAIQAWLKKNGINLPIENITGLGNSTGESKAAWIEENLVLEGFNDIYFVDDHIANVKAVQDMFNTYPPGVLVEGGKSVIAKAKKSNTKNKVIFMVGGPGSGKSNIIDGLGLGDNYTILNPDAIMEPKLKAAGLPLDHSLLETPEQRSLWGKIQAESVKEFKQQIADARAKGLGVVIDGTGASAKVMQAYYKAFADAGYNISAMHVNTSLETALQRNADRERSLMDKIVIGSWDQVQANIPAYKKMFGDNFFQVFTDDLLQFDALPSDFVRDVTDFTLENPIIKYSLKGTADLNKTFNDILETSTGIKTQMTFSEAQGKIRGAKVKTVWDVMYPASAYDFEMFTYRYISEGVLGEDQKQFFKEKLFIPFEVANQKINEAKQVVRNSFKSLIKELPKVKKQLSKKVEGTNYTYDQAIRVYLWNKNGIDIPGISKTDEKVLVETVMADKGLIAFADRLSIISQQEAGYVNPSEYWTVENIAWDLNQMTGRIGRAEFLSEWKQNVSEIFSLANKAKLRAAFGNAHVEALEDMLYRMEYGKNRTKPGRIEAQWNNWVNNSVGAIMFFNMRSATLQTISAINYVDWGDNNVFKAATTFANQPQFWKDFSYIFNSDYLKERRAGAQRTVNEAELAAHVAGSPNKAKAAIAYLLEKGFLPTQIADSFAISSGGAVYYRNKTKAYMKQVNPDTLKNYTIEEAEALAWIDFQDRTEKGQQSARPDLISQQQAGGLGRLILAFKNTPMQYNRLMIKAILDLKNNRGSTGENLSKIAYYGMVQNIIFTSLQTALFSVFGSEDEEEWDNKKERVANGMIDSILNGMGLTGAVAATIKNGVLRYSREKKKGWNADHTRTIIEFANMSPTIGSKLRKLYGAIRTEQMNQGAIEEMGFTPENPAFSAWANLISATTNIPLDRAVSKINNIIMASKSETEVWDKVALVLGWNPWDIGLAPTARKVQQEWKLKTQKEKEDLKKEIKVQEKENALKTIIEQEKEEEKKGEKTIFNCSAVKSDGTRCSNTVDKAGEKCTVHKEVKQRTDNKEVKCKATRTNGEPCNMMTTATSGYCVYHD